MSKAKYRINWTAIILSCLIFLFVPMLSNAQNETTLKIALREDLPPYSYRNAEGKPVGLFVDLWQTAAKKSGFKVDIVFTTAEQSLDYLKQGKVDAIGAVFLGEKRPEQFVFSRPYYLIRVGLFGRQDSDLKGFMETILIRELLKKIDADIDIASSGTEAVEMAKARQYDLILMDIQMPEMDGIEASSIIRSLPEPHGKVPIIALSAFTERQYTDKALSVGVNAYVFKPIDKKTLFKTIKDILKVSQD